MTYLIIDRYPANKVEPLVYEIKMLNDTFKLYSLHKEPLQSAILESFLLHARILIDFLESNRKNKDDLTCSDFTDINGNPLQGEVVNLKVGVKEAINKHLAHLTLKRTNGKAQWRMGEIRNELNKSFRSFVAKCADSNFPEQPNQWRLALLEQVQ
ncbi:MAG TPA: hypothetical protein VEB18_02745 [Candidatus Paceibacterota bacterium]|nr:hypothetical protein [Candidatus Paceibacterota bacterium]